MRPLRSPMPSDAQIQQRLIELIVSSLHKFGYPNADEKNVFTDVVYSEIFRRQLQEALQTIDVNAKRTRHNINELLARIRASAPTET